MGDCDHGWANSRIFGEGEQKRFVRHEKLKHSCEEARFCRRVAQCVGPET